MRRPIEVDRISHLFLAIAILATTFTAQERPTNSPCACPQFTVQANLDTVKAGDPVEFEIQQLDSKDVRTGRFEWSVSQGTIVSGQGTSKIVVQTTRDMLTPKPPATPPADPGEHGFIITIGAHPRRPTLKATAKFVGSDDCSCPEVSATVGLGTRSIAPNKPADVTGLKFSDKIVVIPCEPGIRPGPGVPVSKGLIIDVETTAVDPENDVLTYDYTVSGGRIIGRGAKVRWDLTGAAPGTYEITVGVDDGCGICGKTWTEQVTVVDCAPSCVLVECPTLEIRAPEVLGDESVFTAKVSGGSQIAVTYTWSVVDGEILSGQGTPEIRAKLSSNGSVTVKFGNLDPRGSCLDSVTKEYEDGRLKP